VDIDLQKDPIGVGADGKEVFFSDIWPSQDEIKEVVKATVTPELFRKEYDRVFDDNERWNEIETSEEALYTWDNDSTYIP
ncbi:hypothetical protein KZ287_33155, partial [Escherichia coli]|nr:hypothetical protein [Escherichia coli]